MAKGKSFLPLFNRERPEKAALRAPKIYKSTNPPVMRMTISDRPHPFMTLIARCAKLLALYRAPYIQRR
jgi:hypothetical protein